MIEGDPLLFAEHLENVTRRHSAESIKSIFRKIQSVPLCDHLPCAPVQRHGVGQSPVAIENDSFNSHGNPPDEGSRQFKAATPPAFHSGRWTSAARACNRYLPR